MSELKKLSHKEVRFPKDANSDFINTLRARVKDYFKDNEIVRYANASMVIKTIFMMSLYFVPYIVMMAGLVTSPAAILVMWMLMGFGMAGIGLSIMHDANHGAYSKNKLINDIVGYSINLVGGIAATWKVQHNVLHHTYTNVHGLDEDIAPGGDLQVMRFSPNEPRSKVHRFQHIYAWFLYGLMSLTWVTNKDFAQLLRYEKMGLMKIPGRTFKGIMIEAIAWKVMYYIYILVLPIIFLPVAWWIVVIGFLSLHFICGFVLAIIFQPAHVSPETEFPVPDKDGNLENNWAIHQVLTTTNFAPKSKIFSWFVGGLNFQVEHHLFPNICHVHYKKISSIVKATTKEFGLPYHSAPTFMQAIWQHGKMLKTLGRG